MIREAHQPPCLSFNSAFIQTLIEYAHIVLHTILRDNIFKYFDFYYLKVIMCCFFFFLYETESFIARFF